MKTARTASGVPRVKCVGFPDGSASSLPAASGVLAAKVSPGGHKGGALVTPEEGRQGRHHDR